MNYNLHSTLPIPFSFLHPSIVFSLTVRALLTFLQPPIKLFIHLILYSFSLFSFPFLLFYSSPHLLSSLPIPSLSPPSPPLPPAAAPAGLCASARDAVVSSAPPAPVWPGISSVPPAGAPAQPAAAPARPEGGADDAAPPLWPCASSPAPLAGRAGAASAPGAGRSSLPHADGWLSGWLGGQRRTGRKVCDRNRRVRHGKRQKVRRDRK